MRANEFIVEADPLDKEMRKVQTQRGRAAPAATAMLQKALGAQIKRLGAQAKLDNRQLNKDDIAKIIGQVVSKTMKVNPKQMGQDIDSLAAAAVKDPGNFGKDPNAKNLIGDMVQKSFGMQRDTGADDAGKALDAYLDKNKAAWEDNNPDKQAKKKHDLSVKFLRDYGMSQQQAEEEVKKDEAEEATGEQVRTPGSKDRLEAFTAEVFAPEGTNYEADKEKVVHSNNNGYWSEWKIVKPGVYEFVRNITNEKNIAQLEANIHSMGVKPLVGDFKFMGQDYYRVTRPKNEPGQNNP